VKKLFCFSIVLGVVFYSCKKETTPAPAPPVISFASFTTSDGDNAVLTFNFSDADGDIGLKQSDTSGVYALGTVGYYDFYMRYYYLDSTGNYVTFYSPIPNQPPSLADSAISTYRIPFITDNIKSKSLDGQIIINFSTGYKPGNSAKLNNFRFVFWMYDRALHKSNVVTTPGFHTTY
jgi:hypothetical protein